VCVFQRRRKTIEQKGHIWKWEDEQKWKGLTQRKKSSLKVRKESK
jgi:hypothetical protein